MAKRRRVRLKQRRNPGGMGTLGFLALFGVAIGAAIWWDKKRAAAAASASQIDVDFVNSLPTN